MAQKQISTVLLNFGFAEESVVGTLIMSAPFEFDAPKDALESLAKDVYERFLAATARWQNKCCKEIEPTAAKPFCPGCGQRLLDEFDPELFYEYVRRLPALTLDEFGKADDECDWLLSSHEDIVEDMKNDKYIIVNEAEVVLEYLMREERDNEKLLTDRIVNG